MAVTSNPYKNLSTHPVGVANYEGNNIATFSFGTDRTMFNLSADSIFDPNGNLYIGDWNWSRVLVYKKPFAKISY